MLVVYLSGDIAVDERRPGSPDAADLVHRGYALQCATPIPISICRASATLLMTRILP